MRLIFALNEMFNQSHIQRERLVFGEVYQDKTEL